MIPLAPFLYAVTAAFAIYAGSANRYFVSDACDRLENILHTHVVGQKLGTSLVVEAICAHLKNKAAVKPLVLSLHGPPGVGKSYTHYLAAKALYGLDGGKDSIRLATLKFAHQVKRTVQKPVPAVKEAGAMLESLTGNPIKCPGQGCAGYKVLYGLDYIREEREVQMAMFREAILSHTRRYPESLIVIEEYDKLDCETRAMFRQILNHPEAANVSLSKSIIILESNLGMHEIQHLMQKAGGRQNVGFDLAYHALKDLISEHWVKSNCGDPFDGVKLANLINAFIPYFPLERAQIRALYELKLKELASKEIGSTTKDTKWNPDLVEMLLKSIQFEGAFAIDGAKDTEGPLRRVGHALQILSQDDKMKQQCQEKTIELMMDKTSSKDSLQLIYIC